MKIKKYRDVKRYRHNTKIIIVGAMGGKCQICEYNRCNAALELHHIDPNEKDIVFNKIKSWPQKYIELKKCILLCAICHREVHAGISQIPDQFSKFDEALANKLRTELKSKKI